MGLGHSKRKKLLIGLISSLFFSVPFYLPLRAAEKLEVQIDGMSIPISIEELADWENQGDKYESELSSWLNLLDLKSREGLVKLLNAPLFKDRSMGRQMLRSWVGIQLLDEISDLIRLDDDRSGQNVINTLENLLESQPEVTTLNLLNALPGKTIYLDLDALLFFANNWRQDISKQQRLLSAFAELGLTNLKEDNLLDHSSKDNKVSSYDIKYLNVLHRSIPLALEIWNPSKLGNRKKNWILFMPGLGGSQKHFRWLARDLSEKGWPVVLLEHPGSDSKALKGLLEGRTSAPGAEVLPDRLKDLMAVVSAKKDGKLDIDGNNIVLMGHSLGALTAFLASGSTPKIGLADRCKEALYGLSLTNISQLIQCQLSYVELNDSSEIDNISSIVGINSFGSLLWPQKLDFKTSIPVLLIGGTLDIITPPISEQLRLLLATKPNSYSRVLIIEGASHFSAIRIENNLKPRNQEDLFRLSDSLVGVKPISAQRIISKQIVDFLNQIESNKSLAKSKHQLENGLRFHLMDRQSVKKILSVLNSESLDQ